MRHARHIHLFGAVVCLLCGVCGVFGTARATPLSRTVRVACAPTQPGVVAAALEDALWITLDGGVRWQRVWNRHAHTPMENGDAASSLALSALDVGAEDSALFETPDAAFSDDDTAYAPYEDDSEDDGAQDEVLRYETVRIAIGDRGEAALWYDGALIRISPEGEASQTAWPHTPQALRFDKTGHLWIAANSWVHIIGPQGRVHQRYAPHVRALLQRPDNAMEAVGTYQNTWLLPPDAAAPPVSDAPSPLRPDTADALIHADDWQQHAVFLGGNLVATHDAHTGTWRVHALSQRFRNAVAAPAGQLFARDTQQQWWHFDGQRWHMREIRDVAVDARGDLWVATDAGPWRERGPDDTPAASEAMRGAPPISEPWVSLPDLAHAFWRDVGHPRCPKAVSQFWPDITINWRIGRKDRQNLALPANAFVEAASTRHFVGIRLRWQLAPRPFMTCVAHRQSAHQMINRRHALLRELQLRHRQTQHQAAQCQDALSCALLHIDLEGLRARIQALSRF
ncbi:MAG: hypothetical protein M0R76_09790 [Proteobacteria bacterium]|nr:hypothetical protein [Pseudomonadota bacterium]